MNSATPSQPVEDHIDSSAILPSETGFQRTTTSMESLPLRSVPGGSDMVCPV